MYDLFKYKKHCSRAYCNSQYVKLKLNIAALIKRIYTCYQRSVELSLLETFLIDNDLLLDEKTVKPCVLLSHFISTPWRIGLCNYVIHIFTFLRNVLKIAYKYMCLFYFV